MLILIFLNSPQISVEWQWLISIINEQYLFIVLIIHCENHFYYVIEVWLIDSNYDIIANKYLFGEFVKIHKANEYFDND